MTLSNPKRFYSRFLKGHEGKLHFAAHSHHFWPDVSREAQLQYWDDCAHLSDGKWTKIFGEVVPKAQGHVAKILGLKHPEQVVFAPNTHELTSRLLSLFLGRSSLSVLTTSSEFHSWKRQIKRLSELPEVHLKEVPTDDLLKNKMAFLTNLKSELQTGPDLFFISQVFFDSGLALSDDDLFDLYQSKRPSTIMVVDGYHAFAALPTNLSRLEGNIFYLGGGYKYAQGGEGVGFMIVPKGDWRPAYTGWFAEYGQLSHPPGSKVGYTQDVTAFMGATQDPSGLYRFNAVWDHFLNEGLNPRSIHDYVKSLQDLFMKDLPSTFLTSLTPLFSSLSWHGHFLTFEAPSLKEAEQLEEKMKNANIIIDRRGHRLRFGFGLYQDLGDVQTLLDRLQKLAK